MAKKAELEAEITSSKPDIICLNEVCPKNSKFAVEEAQLNIDGYYIIHDGFEHRGTCIYIANHLIATQTKLGPDFKESVWCEIIINSEKILLGCIYRSPSSSVENNESLNKLLDQLPSVQHDHLVIVGDFNFKEIDWENKIVKASEDHPATKLYDKTNDLFLTQHVHEPTRFRNGQVPSVLDLLFTSNEDMVGSLTINPPIGLSDHVVLNFSLDFDAGCDTNTAAYAYYRGNYNAMREDLDSIDWEKNMENKNVQETWNLFSSTISGLVERHIPKKKYTTRKNPWYNRDIDKARKQKKKRGTDTLRRSALYYGSNIQLKDQF